MSRLTIIARRALAAFRVRRIEISLQDKLDLIPDVHDTATRAAMHESIKQLRRDLAKARSQYSELLPVGKRAIWKLA